MFAKVLTQTYPEVSMIGFVDKLKEGKDIYRLPEVNKLKFDYILILSVNHFESIYNEHQCSIPNDKILKVIIRNNVYQFLPRAEIRSKKTREFPLKIQMFVLGLLARLISLMRVKRNRISFVAKSFVGNNVKALFLHSAKRSDDVILMTDNKRQLKQFQSNGFPVTFLQSFRAIWNLAFSQVVIQDQGNCTEPLMHLSSKQRTIQMWHGVPLKRMNRLGNFTYDCMVSTSDYVNETSLAQVIVAKDYHDFGYPRNDMLLKDHEADDLLLCDRDLYELAKLYFGGETKVIVYMPTHRESATTIGENPPSLIPLDFKSLDQSLKQLGCILIVKLHPFVKQFQEGHMPEKGYENIHFHSAEGDIYPLLKYTDILITDYSSIYFDFLLLNRPIIFFNYDYDEYSSNMNGFVYDYQETAPGPKVTSQKALFEELTIQITDKDNYENDRIRVCNKFFTFQDSNSSRRIFENLLQ